MDHRMTPAPISVERLEIDVVGDVCGPRFEMAPHPAGDYVLYSDYAALLHQLAELEAEVVRLKAQAEEDRELRMDVERQWNQMMGQLEAAERAREEAFSVLQKIADHEGDPLTPVRNSVKKAGMARAFLAASGGA